MPTGPVNPNSASSKRILVVEDDAIIRDLMHQVLRFEGYEVDLAENGRVALNFLEALNHPRPCVIILDLMMPVMNGWELLEALRSKSEIAQIPVIVVTAFDEKMHQFTGATEVFRKPVNMEQLLNSIDRLCL